MFGDNTKKSCPIFVLCNNVYGTQSGPLTCLSASEISQHPISSSLAVIAPFSLSPAQHPSLCQYKVLQPHCRGLLSHYYIHWATALSRSQLLMEQQVYSSVL